MSDEEWTKVKQRTRQQRSKPSKPKPEPEKKLPKYLLEKQIAAQKQQQRRVQPSNQAKHWKKIEQTEVKSVEMMPEALVKRVIAYRRQNDLTQDKLAAKLSINSSRIRALEKGECIRNGALISQIERLISS